MIIEATFFGKTKRVRAEPYNMTEDETPELIWWVESDEDMYALMSEKLRDKKVAVVHREDWLRAKPTHPEHKEGV